MFVRGQDRSPEAASVGIWHNSFRSHLVFVSMAVLSMYHGAYEMLLGSYSPWMDSLILTLIQMLLLLDLKEQKSLKTKTKPKPNKKNPNPTTKQNKKNPKGN